MAIRVLRIEDSSNVSKLEFDTTRDQMIITYTGGDSYLAQANLEQFGMLAGATSVGKLLHSMRLNMQRIPEG